MSEVKAGLADGGDGGLIGWLGPVTSFPKLLILGEEPGEGGGCRRRVKGRKKRKLSRMGVLGDLNDCQLCQCSGLGKDGGGLSPPLYLQLLVLGGGGGD